MALLKAFVCQVVLLGLYKLFLEQVVEEYLVPDELTRNCLVGFVCLLCFGIQLYTEKVEEQTSHAESSKAKSRRRTPPDTAEVVSEFLDARTAHMMRTLDAAMQHMNQMPMSDAYVQNVIFAAAGPEDAVIEQTFVKQPDVVLVEEIHVTKLSDVINANEKSASEPIVVPVKIEEVSEVKRNDRNEKEEVQEEEVEEEESETKSDVCEEEEEDVVTVIDASKPEVEKTKPEATESEEEEEEDEEEEEEKEPAVVDNKRNEKLEEKPAREPAKEEEEEESDEEQGEVKQDAGKGTKKS